MREFLLFGLKQAWACLFGGLLLLAIIVSSYMDFAAIGWHRYDVLFVVAVLIQVLLMVFRLETWEETKTIFVFHVVGTLMELFKTHPDIGSWSYPEDAIFRIATVPLFSGFMYAAVGSYIARSWRLMRLEYEHFPRLSHAIIVAVLIYVNFFTHHFWLDIRWLLFGAVSWLFWRTKVYYVISHKKRSMPLLLSFVLISFFLWIAENVGTFTKVWLYPHQHEVWQIVPLTKWGSWFLLMILSFVMVAAIHVSERKKTADQAL